MRLTSPIIVIFKVRVPGVLGSLQLLRKLSGSIKGSIDKGIQNNFLKCILRSMECSCTLDINNFLTLQA